MSKQIGYHRTRNLFAAQDIVKNGFVKKRRPQIYLTASWESANSLDGTTGGDYGKYLIRCKIDTSNFPKTGHLEKGTGDGDMFVIEDPSIISDCEYVLLDLEDPKYYVNGEVGYKFRPDFPRPEDLRWVKQ